MKNHFVRYKEWFYAFLNSDHLQCIGYDDTTCMDYMDPNVRCPQKAIKLKHSLTHWSSQRLVLGVSVK